MGACFWISVFGIVLAVINALEINHIILLISILLFWLLLVLFW